MGHRDVDQLPERLETSEILEVGIVPGLSANLGVDLDRACEQLQRVFWRAPPSFDRSEQIQRQILLWRFRQHAPGKSPGLVVVAVVQGGSRRRQSFFDGSRRGWPAVELTLAQREIDLTPVAKASFSRKGVEQGLKPLSCFSEGVPLKRLHGPLKQSNGRWGRSRHRKRQLGRSSRNDRSHGKSRL
jgi:hypothetical protein